MRRGVVHDDFDIFFQRSQKPIESQRGSQTVAIGTNVRSNRKAILSLNEFNYLAKHFGSTDFSLWLSLSLTTQTEVCATSFQSLAATHQRVQLFLLPYHARNEAPEYAAN